MVLAKRFFENCPGQAPSQTQPAVISTFTISFAGTKYDFSNETTVASGAAGAIDVGWVNNSQYQRLIITGKQYSGMPSIAGASPNPPPTTIITNAVLGTLPATNPPTLANTIDGNSSSKQNMSHITFQYMAMTQNQSAINAGAGAGGASTMNGGYLYGATQGTLLSYPGSSGPGSNPYAVTIEISPGFPWPTATTPAGGPYGLFNVYWDQGRYFRMYTNSTTSPALVASGGGINNVQVPWGDSWTGCPAANQSSVTSEGTTYNTCLPSQDVVDPNKWTFYLNSNAWPLPVSSSMIVCIKSKAVWTSDYDFEGHNGPSNDIVFDHILWIGTARGVVRGGITGFQITNSAIVPPPPIVNGSTSQAPCIGGSEGGPQIGNKTDNPTNSNYINNFVAQSMGDNAIAFFNDNGSGTTGSSMTNSAFNDDFASPVGMYGSPNVYVGDPTSATNNAWSWVNTHNSIIDADPVPFVGTFYYPRNNPNNLTIPNPPPNGLSYSH